MITTSATSQNWKKKALVPIITQRWLFSQLSKVTDYIIIIYFLVQRIQKVFLTV
jgi:hypothetical protein